MSALPFDDLTPTYWQWYRQNRPSGARSIRRINSSLYLEHFGNKEQHHLTVQDICRFIASGQAMMCTQVGISTITWHLDKLVETGYITQKQHDEWLMLYKVDNA